MLIVPEFLTPDVLTDLLALVKDEDFVDGGVTAGRAAKTVKNNLQIASDKDSLKAISEAIYKRLNEHPVTVSALLPQWAHSLLVSRYLPGMAYGWHVDNPIMPPRGLRTDISITVFLSDPSEYEGGELIIGEHGAPVKCAAGTLIAYPSTSLHCVREVTSGTRQVAVFWVQSRVRDPMHRSILHDLNVTSNSILTSQGKTPDYDRVSRTLGNLIREWVD